MDQRQNTTNTEKTARLRRNLVHLLCGGYLVYLAYRLGSTFVLGIADKGWTGEMIVSLLGAVLFALVGCVLLVNLVRRAIAQRKMKDTEEENA